MKMYFGDFVTTMTTVLLVVAILFVGYSGVKQDNIKNWGRRVALIASIGLLICCFAATRDGYHYSVQASFDSSISAGLFTIDSIQSTLCCIGGAVITFASFSSIFVKNQKYRKIMFFLLGGTMIIKTIIIEISRFMV